MIQFESIGKRRRALEKKLKKNPSKYDQFKPGQKVVVTAYEDYVWGYVEKHRYHKSMMYYKIRLKSDNIYLDDKLVEVEHWVCVNWYAKWKHPFKNLLRKFII